MNDRPPPRVLTAAHQAIREHQTRYYARPVELRMTLNSAKTLAEEAGLVMEERDLEGGQLFGVLIAIDETLDFGEVLGWPTPDEKMWTDIRAKM